MDDAAQGTSLPPEPVALTPDTARVDPDESAQAAGTAGAEPAAVPVDPALLAGAVPMQTIDGAAATAPRPPSAWSLAWRGDWLRTRLPLLIASVVLFAIAAPTLGAVFLRALEAFPLGGPFALLLWALYALPLIWLINRFDFFEREPAVMIVAALGWGGVVATGMALNANQALMSMMVSLQGQDFTETWGPALSGPTTEEPLKAFGIIMVILLSVRRIRSAVDGFVVGAMVGLGFQVVENFIYTINLLFTSEDGTEVQTIWTVFVVRGVLSGLWSHAVYSGIVGMGIGFAFTRRDKSVAYRLGVAALMFAAGWGLHFLWNSPVLVDTLGTVGTFTKAGAILGLLLVVMRRAQGREAHLYTDYLDEVSDPRLVAPAEIDDLQTFRTRSRVVRRAARDHGGEAADSVRQLHRGQADLAVALATGDVAGRQRSNDRILAARKLCIAAQATPPRYGHYWGVAAMWVSLLGLVLPVVGSVIAYGIAAVGTVRAKRSGREVSAALRASWVVATITLVVGVLLALEL